MSENELDEGTRFDAFLQQHNAGAALSKATASLQALVAAVADTGKKGTVTVKVSVEPMKGNADAMLTVIDVQEKLPQNPPKAAIFYADADGNLTRHDPSQPALPVEVKDAPAGPEVRDLSQASGVVRSIGGDR